MNNTTRKTFIVLVLLVGIAIAVIMAEWPADARVSDKLAPPTTKKIPRLEFLQRYWGVEWESVQQSVLLEAAEHGIDLLEPMDPSSIPSWESVHDQFYDTLCGTGFAYSDYLSSFCAWGSRDVPMDLDSDSLNPKQLVLSREHVDGLQALAVQCDAIVKAEAEAAIQEYWKALNDQWLRGQYEKAPIVIGPKRADSVSSRGRGEFSQTQVIVCNSWCVNIEFDFHSAPGFAQSWWKLQAARQDRLRRVSEFIETHGT